MAVDGYLDCAVGISAAVPASVVAPDARNGSDNAVTVTSGFRGRKALAIGHSAHALLGARFERQHYSHMLQLVQMREVGIDARAVLLFGRRMFRQ